MHVVPFNCGGYKKRCTVHKKLRARVDQHKNKNNLKFKKNTQKGWKIHSKRCKGVITVGIVMNSSEQFKRLPYQFSWTTNMLTSGASSYGGEGAGGSPLKLLTNGEEM